MFFNVLIKVDDLEQFVTDWFYYNEKEHYLCYHCTDAMGNNYRTIPNVECEIEVDKPMIFVYAKSVKE